MKIKNYIILLALMVTMFSSCFKDLNTEPIDEDEVTSANLFNNLIDYKQFLAKTYAGLSLTGQEGPAGQADINVSDEGFSSYLRQLWVHQEIPTDEAVVAWTDPGLPQYNFQKWTSSSDFAEMMYYRIFYQITLCNEFIRNSSDEKLSGKELTDADVAEIRVYRAEARLLRALSYWHALDLFGSVPFVTEKDDLGAFLPKQISKKDLFDYIESELLDIEPTLVDARQNEYGRMDKASDWMILAKLYLNASVYIGEDKNTECITYCKKIIDAGYTLDSRYQNLFWLGNEKNNEIIFAIPQDGTNSKTYGGTTFIIHAGIGGSMNDIAPSVYGIDGGWGGHRVTPQFVGLFSDITGATDSRAMFYTDGQTLDIDDYAQFTNGYAVDKFRNSWISEDGNDTLVGSNQTFVDTDFPLFRLADVYLMYAEAVLRGGTGGDVATALGYVNDIRERAYKDESGNITEAQLTLDFILDERGRELYWEGHRRTDLIRFGKFTGASYLWAWKGGVQTGASTDAKYNLYPIPAAEINANPNLTQNQGY